MNLEASTTKRSKGLHAIAIQKAPIPRQRRGNFEFRGVNRKHSITGTRDFKSMTATTFAFAPHEVCQDKPCTLPQGMISAKSRIAKTKHQSAMAWHNARRHSSRPYLPRALGAPSWTTPNPHAKGGEAQENGTSKASPSHQNVAGTHVPQVLVSGPHLMH